MLKEEVEIDAIAEVGYRPASNVVVPISRRLGLTELTERTCKWPIGDPLKDDFHFCGNESPGFVALLQLSPEAGLPAVHERRRAPLANELLIATSMKNGPRGPFSVSAVRQLKHQASIE